MRALFYSIREMFMDWHWFSAINQPWRTFFFLAMYMLLCWLLYEFLRRLVIPLIMILQKKAIKVIGVRFINKKVLVRFNEIILGWFFYVIVPTAFDEKDDWERLLLRITAIYIMVAILRLINTFIEAIINLTQRNKSGTAHPLKGVHQLIQIILFMIGFVLAMAILFDKSPTTLLAGLGASAAVLMLIFKDTILGFVSGIQLTYNDMLRVGDWISSPKYGADGNVEEITLNTVKVRNFDNTLTMVPPYVLVTDSFQNYRFMQLSGGRRIMRSMNFDVLSIGFCTPQQIEIMKLLPLMQTILSELKVDVVSEPFKFTNLGLFRRYMTEYVTQHDQINEELTLMIRQLQPGSEGLPVEVYCFSSNKEWVSYEMIQADIMEHFMGVAPYFGLQLYERAASSWAPKITLNNKENDVN